MRKRKLRPQNKDVSDPNSHNSKEMISTITLAPLSNLSRSTGEKLTEKMRSMRVERRMRRISLLMRVALLLMVS